MGLVRKSKKKTNRSAVSKKKTALLLVFDIVKEYMKNTTLDPVDLQIARFFKKFCSLTSLNRCLIFKQNEAGIVTADNTHQRYLLRILFLKSILPLDILRSLHLFPPKGVELDEWVCLASPCSSSDRYKCQDAVLLGRIRQWLNPNDDVSFDFFTTFGHTWGERKRLNAINQERNLPIGNNSPLLLIPVKFLPHSAKASIIGLCGDRVDHNFLSVFDQLFLCPDHFGEVSGAKLKLSLRSDMIFHFSLEYLYEVLEQGSAVIRAGKKGWVNLPYLPLLVSRLQFKPSFEDPFPVSESTFAAVKSLFNRNMDGGYHNLSGLFASSRHSSVRFENEYNPG